MYMYTALYNFMYEWHVNMHRCVLVHILHMCLYVYIYIYNWYTTTDRFAFYKYTFYISVRIYIYIYVYITDIRLWTASLCTLTHCVYVCMYTYIYVCMYVCMYNWHTTAPGRRCKIKSRTITSTWLASATRQATCRLSRCLTSKYQNSVRETPRMSVGLQGKIRHGLVN
jgi:hypothetical protein